MGRDRDVGLGQCFEGPVRSFHRYKVDIDFYSSFSSSPVSIAIHRCPPPQSCPQLFLPPTSIHQFGAVKHPRPLSFYFYFT